MRGRAHISGTPHRHGDRGIAHDGASSIPTSDEGSIIGNSSDSVAIAIQQLIRSTPDLRPECCIYNVPERFRKGNEEFYKPRVVAIGPYHFKDASYAMCKPKYVDAFFRRNKLNLDHCLGLVRAWEAKARSYYVKHIELSSDKFTFIMLMDATFVLELMLRHHFSRYRDNCDPIFHKPRMIEDVYHDILLIENQLPFFVLEGLYEQIGTNSLTPGDDHLSFTMLTHEFFKHFVKIDKFPAHVVSANDQVNHFVDFIRRYYLAPPPPQEDQQKHNANVHEIPPSVTALDEAGVKFETIKGSASLLNIEFKNGRLKIPNFIVDDWTETLFRNLIAFEQCHDTEKYISQFMFLMMCMIRTSKDADLLMDSGVISSMLGSSKDLSILFNHINRDVGFGEPFHYFQICANLNAYCNTPRHRWKAILKRDYFNTPWKLASTIAAIILLVLTFIQTICSILSL
ncbi:hypothetical protein PRUPE_7G096100 [Prunus persica]|uniref:Uncharacterized protein n=1 Tax=Prunus persica TaxID=3760 RepID=M5VTC1_PRUPE|nr:UPF0481 protein At3g47200 isoform X1 [Prunus persica]XP_020423305.1 UPF0481 protein At3g47200 isoform X1 [Prunus persica]ONH95920.1 hypothetical protein PRUPE_7G096100 [Prunus persica]ONH95921.1 hypothetical protein PRUPE_7G096100 [Prunus persica]